MSDGSIRLRLALVAPGRTEHPPSQEVPIVARKKSLFLAFCVHA